MALLTFVRREDEKMGFRGTTHEVARRRVEASSHSIDCAKARTLNSTLQIADECPIKPSFQVKLHLRHAEFFSDCPDHFSKRPLHTRAGLDLFSTLGHVKTHRALLSAIGQRVVTDNRRMGTSAEGVL